MYIESLYMYIRFYLHVECIIFYYFNYFSVYIILVTLYACFPDEDIEIDNLSPETEYTIEVAAKNAFSQGPGETIQVKTKANGIGFSTRTCTIFIPVLYLYILLFYKLYEMH